MFSILPLTMFSILPLTVLFILFYYWIRSLFYSTIDCVLYSILQLTIFSILFYHWLCSIFYSTIDYVLYSILPLTMFSILDVFSILHIIFYKCSLFLFIRICLWLHWKWLPNYFLFSNFNDNFLSTRFVKMLPPKRGEFYSALLSFAQLNENHIS